MNVSEFNKVRNLIPQLTMRQRKELEHELEKLRFMESIAMVKRGAARDTVHFTFEEFEKTREMTSKELDEYGKKHTIRVSSI